MMSSRLAYEERKNFSDRLQEQLRKAGVKVRASVVAHEFNLRADGATITTYAARKWLMGEAMPTHERMLILASWLGVHASWLQYGDADNGEYVVDSFAAKIPTPDLVLLQDFQRLPDAGKTVVRELVKVLLAVLPKHDGLRSLRRGDDESVRGADSAAQDGR